MLHHLILSWNENLQSVISMLVPVGKKKVNRAKQITLAKQVNVQKPVQAGLLFSPGKLHFDSRDYKAVIKS